MTPGPRRISVPVDIHSSAKISPYSSSNVRSKLQPIKAAVGYAIAGFERGKPNVSLTSMRNPFGPSCIVISLKSVFGI